MKDLAKFNSKSHEKSAPNQEQSAAAAVAQVQMLTISEEDVGQRIDNFLLKICKGVPKSHVYQKAYQKAD